MKSFLTEQKKEVSLNMYTTVDMDNLNMYTTFDMDVDSLHLLCGHS